MISILSKIKKHESILNRFLLLSSTYVPYIMEIGKIEAQICKKNSSYGMTPIVRHCDFYFYFLS